MPLRFLCLLTAARVSQKPAHRDHRHQVADFLSNSNSILQRPGASPPKQLPLRKGTATIRSLTSSAMASIQICFARFSAKEGIPY